jgi:hypothetical protein
MGHWYRRTGQIQPVNAYKAERAVHHTVGFIERTSLYFQYHSRCLDLVHLTTYKYQQQRTVFLVLEPPRDRLAEPCPQRIHELASAWKSKLTEVLLESSYNSAVLSNDDSSDSWKRRPEIEMMRRLGEIRTQLPRDRRKLNDVLWYLIND